MIIIIITIIIMMIIKIIIIIIIIIITTVKPNYRNSVENRISFVPRKILKLVPV